MAWPKYLRSGHTWSSLEDQKLYYLLFHGNYPDDIAQALQRTPWAISCRADKMYNVRWDEQSEMWKDSRCVANLGDLLKERNVNDSKFWMCWVEGMRGPEVYHWSIDNAMTEAKRLTAKTGRVTHVMEVCGHFSPAAPQPPEPVWTVVR